LLFFRRHVASAEVALDLTAETFAAALEGASRYERRPDPARGWLCGIAWNKLHEAQRRGRAEDKVRRALGMAAIVLRTTGSSGSRSWRANRRSSCSRGCPPISARRCEPASSTTPVRRDRPGSRVLGERGPQARAPWGQRAEKEAGGERK
jgi:hypothetical protein